MDTVDDLFRVLRMSSIKIKENRAAQTSQAGRLRFGRDCKSMFIRDPYKTIDLSLIRCKKKIGTDYNKDYILVAQKKGV